MPRRVKTKPIFAPSTASRMSIGSVIVMPTPTAGPVDRRDHRLRAVEDPQRDLAAAVARHVPVAIGGLALAPVERLAALRRGRRRRRTPRPSPVTTTARTSSSASARSNAAISSRRIVSVNAFSRSGRFSVIVRTPSAACARISSKSVMSTHAIGACTLDGREGVSCRANRRPHPAKRRRPRRPSRRRRSALSAPCSRCRRAALRSAIRAARQAPHATAGGRGGGGPSPCPPAATSPARPPAA